MNPYEQAMKMEQAAEKFYRDMADKTYDSNVKKVLIMLADEEVKHYKAFEKMSKSSNLGSVVEYDMTEEVGKIFTEIKSDNKRYNFNKELVEFYRKAAKNEDNSYNFYMEQAAASDNEEYKQAFISIAAEEKRHEELLENLADFVESPDTWLESAEFYRITEEE